MGQAAVPIIMAVAAAGVSAYNTQRTAKKQDRAAAEGIRRQAEMQRQASGRSAETLGYFEDSRAEPYEQRLSDKYRRQLRRKQQKAFQGLDTPIDMSDAAKARSGRAVLTANDYADALQGFFSVMDAAKEQRRDETIERGDLASALEVLGRNSAQENYLTQMRVNSIRRSPWLDILAAGLSGASSGMSGGFSFGGGQAPLVPGTTQTPQTFYSASSAARLPGQYGTPTGRVFSIFGP